MRHNPGYLLGMLIGGLIAGVLCGLLPLFLGRSRGREGLAWGGFATCAVGGFIGGLILAVPAAIIFTIIICSLPSMVEQQRRRWHPEFDDEDDRYPRRRSRYDDDYDRPARRDDDDYDRPRRYEDDDDRPSRRGRDDWSRPRQDDRPQPKEEPKQSPPSKGFGYREID